MTIKSHNGVTHSEAEPAILVGVGGPLLAARLHIAVTKFAIAIYVITVSVCLR